MAHAEFLFAAFAVTWAGIFIYVWTLRRGVRRLTDELASLAPEHEPLAVGVDL